MNMGSRFMSISTFVSEQDDSENSGDSPRFAMLNDGKMASTSSPKKRRSIQKRVISVPIKDIEGSRLKSETGGAPPSDSWSWRKYGQKPIKGSPYPRGYYKCSSSKGCPARKQVEKSMLDPNMLMVTYSYEHNHPWPTPRNHHNHNVSTRKTPIQTETTNSGEEYQEEEEQKPTINLLATQKSSDLINNSHIDDKKYGNHGAEATNLISDYGCTNNWFSDFECTSSTTMLESPLMSDARVTDSDMAMVFTMRDEDDSFFADLGELPECSTVFRHRGLMIDREEEHHRRHNLAPWCGTI